jgi:hypothetical protein
VIVMMFDGEDMGGGMGGDDAAMPTMPSEGGDMGGDDSNGGDGGMNDDTAGGGM